MAFKVPGLEALTDSLSHWAKRDIGATTSVVHGAGSTDDEFFGNLGKLVIDDGLACEACIEISDLWECMRLSISIVFPRPISVQVSIQIFGPNN